MTQDTARYLLLATITASTADVLVNGTAADHVGAVHLICAARPDDDGSRFVLRELSVRGTRHHPRQECTGYLAGDAVPSCTGDHDGV